MNQNKKSSWRPEIVRMIHSAKAASVPIAQLGGVKKRQVLEQVARALISRRDYLIKENSKDVREAERNGLSSVMLDRLTLNIRRIQDMAEGVRAVATLEDPIGKTLLSWKRPNGLRISKVTVPIGVILIIYESRPNVTVECASLCLKSGNAVILRGGREAFHSNRALVAVFEQALSKAGLPKGCVNLVGTTDRSAVDFLLKQENDIHLVIPRGGQSLIRKVVAKSRIPVIKHYQGICHVYIDRKADMKKAFDIVMNAKMQRPGVCNAAETLLVHRQIGPKILPVLAEKLTKSGCEIRADRLSKKWMPGAKAAKPDDFGREFLDKILAVKMVTDIHDAIRHIQQYGSAHTDAIVTEDREAAKMFKTQVDSSSVMVNASTRFSDGFQYGFGAEIGISTDKIHARGPMGLEGLTSYKYIVEGDGHIRS